MFAVFLRMFEKLRGASADNPPTVFYMRGYSSSH